MVQNRFEDVPIEPDPKDPAMEEPIIDAGDIPGLGDGGVVV